MKLLISTIFPFLLPFLLHAQLETYSIYKASFSKDTYDEFSPVYYNNGLVYCANRSIGISNYSTSLNENFFSIYFVDTTGNGKKAKLFSKDIRTVLNDGPVTFNGTRDTIYFSRNLVVEGKLNELSSTRNKLGIFQAVLEGEKWTRIREFRFNNEWYNVTTPCLSPDGQRLYFASDRPDGFGGFDLYYCEWKGNYWDSPVNLGPVINTSGNEAYPYLNPAGELFFSSDGHPGLGGRDIFFSRLMDSTWLIPIRLDPPINSEYDDFGITTDTLMNEGYFSSNRDKSIDIFHFRTNLPQIFHANIQRENQYCFFFHDDGSIDIDTLVLQYKWNFGDENPAFGAFVDHCFPGPGNYIVSLDVLDRTTGKHFFTKLKYNLELKDVEQAFINSVSFAVKGDEVDFDGMKSYLPGFSIVNYAWDFGDGNRAFGESLKHTYNEKGEYFINLEIALRSDLTGNIKKTGVSKKIVIVDTPLEKEYFLAERHSAKIEFPDIRNGDNAVIRSEFSAEAEYQENTMFTIELLATNKKLELNNDIFSKLPDKYRIIERYDSVNSVYSYTVDQHLSLMATYPAFNEIFRLGFKDVQIKILTLQDPEKKELHNLMKIHGNIADSYFDSGGRLTANALIMSDQIVRLMNKYPAVRLEVAVHSDNTGSAAANLALTQRRAQMLVNYLVNRGISSTRLVVKGFGGSKPIAANFQEQDRRLNQRIEFIIIDE